jgi:hypothetical protein
VANANRFDSFTMKEMDSMWYGMCERRTMLQDLNLDGIYTAEIESISAMFMEMYRSVNWGRKVPSV